MLGVVVQIDGFDPATAQPVTLRAASHDDPTVCHADGGEPWWPALIKLPTLRYDLFDGAFGGEITAPSSSLTIAAEPWPNFGRYALADARLRLWTGDVGAPWASWTLRFDGRVSEQPELADGTASINFAVDDRWLDRALLATYAGTSGAEGTEALKGQPKPLALGAPRYAAGTLIDNIDTVFQLSAYGRMRGFEAALERLARFGGSVGDFASYAALVAADVPAGRWATAKAAGMVRLGAPPTGQVSFLIGGDDGGPDGWARLPGAIIRRLALLSGGAGKIDDASLNALDAARPYNQSIYVDQQTTARQLIQQIAASVNAVAGMSWTGQLFVVPVGIGAPGLTLAADGSALPAVASVKQVGIASPFQKLAIGAARAWTVHALSDIAFTATLIDLGTYVEGTTYREGNIVSLADGSRWLFINATASAGHAPPGGIDGDEYWANLSAPIAASSWDDIADPNGTKPANNADVTGDNTAKDTNAVGGKPAAELLATIDKVVPLEANTQALKDAQTLLDAAVKNLHGRADVATDALTALDVDIADADAARRQLERDAGRLSDTVLQLLLMANRTQETFRDAGFVVDQASGEIRIYAVDQLAGRQNLTEVTLDAQRALINSKASSNEVDEKILRAVLNPEQVAQLEPLIARIAAVEIIQDGLRADITLKADLVELTKALARITDAELNISAAEGLIRGKVEQTAFDNVLIRLGSAEFALQSYGDLSRFAVELRQARADNVETGAGLLSSVLAANDANDRLITAIGGARQELYTKITGVGADLAVESRARTLLEAEVGSLDARSVQDRLTLVRANEVLAQDIDALGTQNETQEAKIATLQRSSLTLAGGVAGIETSIRQQARGAGLSDAALLADVVGGDEATRRLNNSLAEIQTQLTTTLVAGFAASAVARETLRARIDQADARFAQEVGTTADRFKAVTQALTVLDAAFADPTNGLAATAAQIARLERTTAEQNTATVELITGLRAIVNDPASGLPKTRADLTALTTAVADQNRVAISRLEGLEATVNDGATGLAATVAKLNQQIELSAERDNARAIEISQLAVELHDPATGLPAVRATATADRQASVTRDNANARSVEQVTARLDGVGEVGIEQAFSATVNRLGLIEAQASLVFDVNGNLFGWKIIGGAEGPASFNLINTDFRMGTGRVIFNNGTFMKVQGVGFGVARDLLDWFGPTMALDQCSRANAISYEATDGDKYTGGSFSAGTLKNASASSGLGTAEVAEIGPFGSNGKPVKYVVSWSYRTQSTRTFAATPEGLRQYRDTAASYNATDDYGVLQVEHPASTIKLTRAFSGGAFAQIDQRSFTTETQTFVGSPPSPGDGPGRADFTTTIGGGFTVNDPNQIANDRTVRLALARGFTSAGDAVSQRLTIVAIEE